ncbi:MAG: imelysin family protein [Pseudomonadota bacterium]
MRPLLALALCLLPFAASAESPLTSEMRQTLQAGLVRTADEFVLPAYQQQSSAAQALEEALISYCAGGDDLDTAYEEFADLFLAWQRASLIATGPITEAEGPMRVQLWPDPKGFSQRAIRAALREGDPVLLQPGGVAGRSIALTGLTALEYLLYSDLRSGSYGCDLATSIAAYQADLAEDLVTHWTPGSAYRQAFDTAVTGNATYPNLDAALREVLAGMVVYVDRLRKFKLLRGLGDERGTARAERTEARLSALGLASIGTSFRALADIYDVPYGLFDTAPDVGGSMEYLVLSDFAAAAAETTSIMDGTLEDIANADGLDAEELRRFADIVFYHEAFLKTGFMAALGLSAGFTAADGD